MGADSRARAEFDAAYPVLVRAAFGAARRFFRFDASAVDDVVAEAMARTYERWEKVRRHDNPSGWVVVCTKNVCLEHVRASSRRAPMSAPGSDALSPIDDHAAQFATSAAIAEVLGQLSKRQRDVAVLRYLMDLDEATTADALGMSVSQVKTAGHEARTRLRVLLADVYRPKEESA